MKDVIKNFNAQFAYEPKIENGGAFQPHDKFIVAGMGGSHLAADILKMIQPHRDMIIHMDYGLPNIVAEDLKNRLFIASSYSGNTEEVIDGLLQAHGQGVACIVVSTGGRCIEIAKEKSIPYILLPDIGIQPRMALGFSLRALLKIIGDDKGLEESVQLVSLLKPDIYEWEGRALAEKLHGKIPVIYASNRNSAIAYHWKIKFNETGKIPAFYNVLPEVNHNEMAGFDARDSTRQLSDRFHFIFLKDASDDPRIARRMEILERLYRERGFEVEVVEFVDENPYLKIFSSFVLADWAAYYIAERYGVDPERVPMVEEFKRQLNG